MSQTGRRVVLGVVLAATLAVGVGLGALLFGGDDGTQTITSPPSTVDSGSDTTTAPSTAAEDEAPTPPPTISEEDLSGDALEFAIALNEARTLSYHARYEGQGQRDDGTMTELVVEVWRRLPQARRDFTISGAGEQVISREYQTAAGVTGCIDTTADDVDDFQCTDATASGSDPGAPAFGAVDPHAGPVEAVDDNVGGVTVRCYRVTRVGQPPQEVCFDDGGIPVVVDDGELRLVRTVVDSAIDDDVFDPPAS